MIGRLIKWALIILIGILVYNYFYGTDQEQQTSVEIFNEVKELGTSVKEVLAQEKERYEQGKYDGLVDQLNSVWNDIRSSISKEDQPGQFEQLESEKKQLERDLNNYKGTDSIDRQKILSDMERFMHRADSLLKNGRQ